MKPGLSQPALNLAAKSPAGRKKLIAAKSQIEAHKADVQDSIKLLDELISLADSEQTGEAVATRDQLAAQLIEADELGQRIDKALGRLVA